MDKYKDIEIILILMDEDVPETRKFLKNTIKKLQFIMTK